MNDSFSFDFYKLLKKIQAKPIKIALTIIITFTLTSIAEVQFFFQSYTKYDINGCQIPNNSSSGFTINNCFGNDAKDLTVTNCLNSLYGTNSNYSLEFRVPVVGINGIDKFSKIILALAFISYFSILGFLQIAVYFQFQKRKRIQDIIAGSMVFVDGTGKYERIIGWYSFGMAFVYLAIKIIWIMYRASVYGKIDCDGTEYIFELQQGLSTSIGIIIQTLFTCIILPLVYVLQSKNYLNDINLKEIMTNFTNESLKQFKYISILKTEKYKEILDNYFKSTYPNDTFITRFFRSNTFSFSKTPNSEIIQIILNHKKDYPQDFEPMLYKESKISIKTLNNI
ncbi:hypothetical protein DICPUDRAFT_27579 [Dictyostelium purpureum]|uniref:Uncharacterized protein n=1 Tax=Dictyostelium purpureum TaxID=5786 RepID=F0ZAH4_DICPU|nr:uncharacterized protein DICPUDRAFT_27579 [Dictyostelium purpureum]EGC39072.1 hypothetical protein DICPUDRAFT_27579 [Dictyostelium purpureum]|eukprot:XP_003284422.1 hypothetical protein DICPUDRAFT_27579 [Dictyostelium purpureum]